jgi:hypothetical protein
MIDAGQVAAREADLNHFDSQARAAALENGDPVPLSTRLAWGFWDFMVLKNLRRMLGFDRRRVERGV